MMAKFLNDVCVIPEIYGIKCGGKNTVIDIESDKMQLLDNVSAQEFMQFRSIFGFKKRSSVFLDDKIRLARPLQCATYLRSRPSRLFASAQEVPLLEKHRILISKIGCLNVSIIRHPLD